MPHILYSIIIPSIKRNKIKIKKDEGWVASDETRTAIQSVYLINPIVYV